MNLPGCSPFLALLATLKHARDVHESLWFAVMASAVGVVASGQRLTLEKTCALLLGLQILGLLI